MPTRTSLAMRRELAPGVISSPDGRLHRRTSFKLSSRFMHANRQANVCEHNDVSVGDLEGEFARIFDGGFAISFTNTMHKRDPLAARSTWLTNRNELSEMETRAHERRLTGRNRNTFKLSGRISQQAHATDVLHSGANVATRACHSADREIQLYELRVEVVGHVPDDIGIRSKPNQSPEVLNQSFS